MLKKMLIIIPVIGIVLAALVQGTQTNISVGQVGQRVVLTTDSGVVKDKSFNQDSFLGLTNFISESYGIDGSKNNYVEGIDHSKIAILNTYKLALIKKADAIVAPGFPHIEALEDPSANFLKDTTVVLLDAKLDKPNIISVLFNSELAGLQAGFDTAFWATRKDDKGKLVGDISGDGKIKIGTFGGASMKFSVDSYMFGLFLGMELFNITIGQQEKVSVEYANSSNGTIQGLNPTGSSDSQFFTGTFTLGDATKSGILGNLVDTRGADIIFPVAGPQIQDVISYKAKPSNGHDGYRPYLIGVDIDQSITYEAAANEGRFVTSAVKNLHDATYVSLSHAKHLRQPTKDGVIGEWNTDAGVDIWDGKEATKSRNWSEGAVGGKNKIQKHVLKLYEEGQGNEEIQDTPIDKVLKKIIDFFDNQAGNTVQEYLNGRRIKRFADSLKDDISTLIDPSILKNYQTKEVK